VRRGRVRARLGADWSGAGGGHDAHRRLPQVPHHGQRQPLPRGTLGAAPCLIQLYEECSNTLLRRNAQSALANIAMLAENGLVLLEAKLPEEFLVPMRLTKEEVAELVVEFPNGGLQEAFDKHQKERLEVSNAAVAALSKKK
jgi:hypothetical protein